MAKRRNDRKAARKQEALERQAELHQAAADGTLKERDEKLVARYKASRNPYAWGQS